MSKNIIYGLMLTVYLLMMGACSHSHSDHNHDDEHGKEQDDHDNHEGHDHEHDNDHSGEDEIIFTKAQVANALNFSVEKIEPSTFHNVIKVSGQILSAPGDETQVSATMSGIVKYSSAGVVEGSAVRAGQGLFSISSQNLAENNQTARVAELRSIYENAKSEYERAQALVKDQIVSQQEFDQKRSAYEQARISYQTLSKGMGAGGTGVSSPMTGFVKRLMIQSGQYVEVGTPLAIVTQNKRLILRADVSQRYLADVRGVQTANFITPYDNHTYSLSDLNGRLVSFGRSASDSYYIPVSFEFDNIGSIIEGTFVEIYLKSQPIPDALVLPRSALIEEYGHFYVFVQLDEEGYAKKEVKIGASDGINTQILSGISAGDAVVTQGAYAIKLASLQGAMPEHSHSH